MFYDFFLHRGSEKKRRFMMVVVLKTFLGRTRERDKCRTKEIKKKTYSKS